MPITRTRPPTEEERRIIGRIQHSGSTWSNDLLGAGCLAVFVLLIGVFISKFTGFLRGQEIWYVMLGIIAGVSVMFRMRSRTTRLRKKAVRDDRFYVEETTYDITGAIKIEELEDEGSNYYLKLIDGGVLFLSGQYLYDIEESRKFPSIRVKTVRTSATRALLDIECLGDYIAPSAVLPAFSKERFRTGDIPNDGDILSIPFETLLPS